MTIFFGALSEEPESPELESESELSAALESELSELESEFESDPSEDELEVSDASVEEAEVSVLGLLPIVCCHKGTGVSDAAEGAGVSEV